MSAINLSPKSPIVIAGLLVGALYLVSRNRVHGSTVRPIGAQGLPPSQYRPTGIAAALQAAGSLFSTAQPSVVTDTARAAVRAGDPYYGGPDAVAGTTPNFDQWAQDAQAYREAYAAGGQDSASGDPYNP
jgi:hypothetical protein